MTKAIRCNLDTPLENEQQSMPWIYINDLYGYIHLSAIENDSW
ncbi:MAG: hypothetical protein ABI045_01710 [Flavobacteriales bacterium]